jgi:MoaD family protein
MITVKLFGLVRLETGIKELQVEADNVRQLQKALTRQIPEEKIKGCLLLVNGKQANRFTKLKDGDQVMLMPPVAGG